MGYQELFRSKLNPNGDPVPYESFRAYMLETLHALDQDQRAQELIVEQFIEEAQSGRQCFHCTSFDSITDAPFRSKIDPVEAPLRIPTFTPSSRLQRMRSRELG